MLLRKPRGAAARALLLAAAAPALCASAAFSPTSLLALRVASSAGATPACPSADAACARATEVYLDEYDVGTLPTFSLVRTQLIAGVTLSGTDFYVGQLVPCADGSCVIFAAGTDAPGTAPQAGPPYWPAPRVIVRISQDGTIDASTRIAAADFNGVVKGVCSFDGSGYWVVGNATNGGCVGYVKHGAGAGAAGGYTTVASGAGCSTADAAGAPMVARYTSCLASVTNVQGGAKMADRTLLFARSFNDYGLVDIATSPQASWSAPNGLQLLGATTATLDAGFSDATLFMQVLASRAQDSFWTLDPSPGTCGVQQCVDAAGARNLFPAMKSYLVDTQYSPQAACGWPLNLSNVQCFGLTYNSAPDAAACAAAACALKLPGWQWTKSDGCWLGSTGGYGTCLNSPNPWVGGGLSWTSSTTGCRTLFSLTDVCDYSGFALSRDEGTLYLSTRSLLYAHASRSGGGGVARFQLPANQEFRGVAVAPAWCDRSGLSPFAGFYCPGGANSTTFRCPAGNYSNAGAGGLSCPLPLPTPSPTPTTSITPTMSATPTNFNAAKPCFVASTLAGPDYITPNNPKHLTFDKRSGAVYVADTGLSEVSRIAGGASAPWVGSSGVRGCVDGVGTAALMYWPNSIVSHDVTGDFFVPDGFYHVVRRISSAGRVTTAAGVCGARGYVDGDTSIARFYNPFATAIDSARDRLYLSDNNNLIRVLDNLRGDIVVRTLCGLPQGGSAIDGVGTASRFNNVYGLAIDATRQMLYASDYNNQRIRRIDLATSTVITIAGGAAGLPSSDVGTSLRFGNPTGIALDPTFSKL